MDSWFDLENIMVSLQNGGTEVATGAVNLAQTFASSLPSVKEIKAKIYNAFDHEESKANSKRSLNTRSLKLSGDYNRRMIPMNVKIFVICLVAVLCSCVLAKVIMVPMTQSSNEEINARRYRYRTGKNEYIMYKSEE